MQKAKLSEEDDLQMLLYPPYVLDYDDIDSPSTIVRLPNEAMEALEQYEQEKWHWRIPMITSVCALILSAIAILATANDESLLWKLVTKGVEVLKQLWTK